MKLDAVLGTDKNKVNTGFIKGIINGMRDWVRVLDRDDNILFINKAMTDELKNYTAGKKCFEVLGRTKPCDNCVSRKSVFDGESHEKEEIIGDRVFSVVSSPVRNSEGEIVAVVEVLRDVTQTRILQQKLLQQNIKLENDLSLARKLQCRLLPVKSPEDRIDFAYVYKPCEKLGGDFLDIFRIDERHTCVYIADVSGHGVAASMLTVFLRSSIDKSQLSPSLALKRLYREFNKSGFDPELYITIFYAVLDLKEKTMVYSNAGHNVSPFVYSGNRFELLRVPGVPISNWVDEPSYSEASVALNTADRIFMSTDGVVELKSPGGEQFGEERLLEAILDSSGSISTVLNKALNMATSFACTEDPNLLPDDITMALLEMK